MKLKKRRDPETFDLQIVVLGHKLGGKIWFTEKKEGGWTVHVSRRTTTPKAVGDLVAEVLKEHNLSRASTWASLSKVAEW